MLEGIPDDMVSADPLPGCTQFGEDRCKQFRVIMVTDPPTHTNTLEDSPITDGLNTDLHLDIGNGVLLEKVDKFLLLERYVGCR